ncbi:MAG: CoA transferase [SAR202 cluster bacterium]|nr:CoA transferase [SAR202 cluster bacterium]
MTSQSAPKKPLSGIRVLELGPYVALPLTGRILASLGAEVIKVETNKVLDEMNFIPAWSRGGGQPEFQRAKKRITIDVRTPDGLEVFKELVKVSDVFMTNFRRNILDRWGIDFPELRRLRPDIILMWQTGLGGIGPYYTYKSYGILVQHMGGVSLMSGEEGEPPATINTSYSDYHTGVFQPVAIMGALLRRKLTGQPATMESSIFKSGALTAGPAILDYQSNGRMPQRIGNRDPFAAPHGVYQCQGDDRWCAIAVQTEEQWSAFCRVIGSPDWCQEDTFSSLDSRLANQERLDELVGQWTADQTAEAVMTLLQDAGVPASVVSQGQDLHDSAHLKAREFYRPTPFYLADRSKPAYEWDGGEGIASAVPPKLSVSPMEFGSYSNIGEDNDYVFKELLGMSDADVTKFTENQSLY